MGVGDSHSETWAYDLFQNTNVSLISLCLKQPPAGITRTPLLCPSQFTKQATFMHLHSQGSTDASACTHTYTHSRVSNLL